MSFRASFSRSSSSLPRSASWLRPTAVLMSIVFPVTSLIALPAQAWAQSAHSSAFAAPKPVPAPVVHDDPAWHTIDYHARERADAPVVAKKPRFMRKSTSITLLNDVGNLKKPVSARDVAIWQQQLDHDHLTPSNAAKLHLWLGEYQMAHNQNPEQAMRSFSSVQRTEGSKTILYGLSAYDTAVALYYEGAYQQATSAFRHLLLPATSLRGYSRRTCARFLGHAKACAGYHAERAALGIPEPPKLDPLCAAAALAQSLKALGRPSAKTTVLAKMHVTGEGSNLRDITAAAKCFSMDANVVHADDKGLIALPKPLIAYVEHDHYVSLVRADKRGVSYLCSDCGSWPGGRVDLTWKQWHKMEATAFVVISPYGSETSRSVSTLLLNAGQQLVSKDTSNHQSKTVAPNRREYFNLCGVQPPLLPLGNMIGHVTAYVAPDPLSCGLKINTQACACEVSCPTHSVGTASSLDFQGREQPEKGTANNSGPASGIYVNVASGEIEYMPQADLSVYNPLGPSVSWSRSYRSLRDHDVDDLYEYDDYGLGWANPYQAYMSGFRGTEFNLVMPNGVFYDINCTQNPDASHPRIAVQMPLGTPFLVENCYNADGSSHYEISFTDRTKWIMNRMIQCGQDFEGVSALSQIVDRNGNAINFHYIDASTTSYNLLLSSITDKNDQVLLTVNRSPADESITSVTDRYGRSVYYQMAAGTGMLGHVSQVVQTGTASPADRYIYGNSVQSATGSEGVRSSEFLHSITVPSPTGTGTKTATINYDPNWEFISNVVDANGNCSSFIAVDSNHTQVSVKNSANSVIYRYTAGFDAHMSQTNITNGVTDANGNNTQVVSSPTYADPNNPYRASQVQDGNGYAINGLNGKGTWEYTWDQWGNCLSETSPRGVTTTNNYSYQNFALGELISSQEGGKVPTTYSYYEPSGLTHTVSQPLPGSSGGNQTVQTSYVYDSLGNITTMMMPGNNAVASRTITYNYATDGAYNQPASIGQPLVTSDTIGTTMHFRYDARGNRIILADALGNQTNTSYNIADQVQQEAYPATGQTGTGQAAEVTSYLYADGAVSSISNYDESGNLSRQVTSSYGMEGELLARMGSKEPVSYTYDALYRRKTTADGNGHSTFYFYNTAGYLSRVSYPGVNGNLDSVQTPNYDANGNLLTRIDGRGITTNYVYNDPESRKTDTTYPASPAINTHTDYDSYGRIAVTSDGTGIFHHSYDDNNLSTSTQANYTGLPALSMTYSYYPDSSRQSMTTPAGNFSYQYDARGRITGLNNPYGEAFAWTYLANGWLWTQTSASAAQAVYTYNARGFMTSLQNTTSTNAVLSTFNNAVYDSVGNRTAMAASLPSLPAYGGATTYSYDTKNQLLQEQSSRSGSYTNNFGYDASGNSTTFKGAAKNFNSDNQDTANVYDGSGNPTTYNGASLSFDAENRLTAYGTTMAAGYTGDNQRAWKQNGAGTVYFLYDMTDPVCEISAAGVVMAVNTFGNGGLLSRHANASSVFYTFDLQGNAAQRLSSTGNVLSSQILDAIGTRASTDANTDPFNGHDAQWGYYSDAETGLEALTFRYYDPGTGRFLTRDPLGYEGGINLYEYAGNNTPNANDPLGLKLEFCMRAVVWGICPPKELCHWYLKTSQANCPYIGYGPGGVMLDKGGNEAGEEQHCTPLSATPRQEACLCRAALYGKGGGSLCGSKWIGKGDYHPVLHNCQAFVQCLLSSCGLPRIQ